MEVLVMAGAADFSIVEPLVAGEAISNVRLRKRQPKDAKTQFSMIKRENPMT